jgi:hypothetical protein
MRLLGAGCALLLLAGCSADRIERGVFHSRKGYDVTLPAAGWVVEPRGRADLSLRRAAPAQGGMLADATCEGRPPTRPLGVLARHLLFGLADRSEVERRETSVAGRSALRSQLSGRLDGVPVRIEAVVAKDERCVYDFLYVAPEEAFEAGRADFGALVESFAVRPAP